MGPDCNSVVAMMRADRGHHRDGLTLLEVVISSLLVGTVLVTSLSATASWRRFHLQTRSQDIARRLAEELVSEITSVAFIDPTQTSPQAFARESGETTASRFNWNDIDDYHGMLETTVRDKSGTLISDATGFTRSAVISSAMPIVNPPGYAISSELNSPLRHILVTVTSPSGQMTTATGLKSNLKTAFPSALVHVRSITIDLNDGGARTVRSVGVVNHPQVTP